MRRLLPLLAAQMACAVAFAGDSFLGTKSSPLSTTDGASATGIGPGSLIQMLLALAAVFVLLKYVLPRFAGRLKSRIRTPLDGGLKVEESASVAGGSLYIVSARGKTLLLGVVSGGVQCLADLTDGREDPAPHTFDEMVRAANPERVEAYVAEREAAPSDPGEDRINEALRRLERFAR